MYMGMDIYSPLNYSTPYQTSPEIAGGPGTYTITSFTGIQLNNIDCMALQTNGITATFWVSTNDPEDDDVDLCESAATNFPIFNGTLGLPIKFKDFIVTEQNDHASLSWTTINETGVKEFTVQQKIESGAFQNIAVVPTKVSGSYTNQTRIYYKTILPELLAQGNEYFYRIQITYLNGNSDYSELRMLRGKKSPFAFKIYPNPSHGQTSLIFPWNTGNITITVIDVSGRVLMDLKNRNSQSILIEKLRPGIYIVRVFNMQNNIALNKKLIVQN